MYKNKEDIKKYQDFYCNSENGKKKRLEYRMKNRKKLNDDQKERNVKSHDRISEYCLMHRYGLTIEDYNYILEQQGGVCEICRKPVSEFNKRLHVDHDHNTGVIRGLICSSCNLMLGHAKDNVNILGNAILYIYRYRGCGSINKPIYKQCY